MDSDYTTVVLTDVRVFPNGWVWGEDAGGGTFGLPLTDVLDSDLEDPDGPWVTAHIDTLRT